MGVVHLLFSKIDLQGAAQTTSLPYRAPSLSPRGTRGYPRKDYPQTGTSFQLDLPAARSYMLSTAGISQSQRWDTQSGGEPGWVADGPWSSEGLTGGQGREMKALPIQPCMEQVYGTM